MSQYKDHPFIIALNAIAPVIVPSFKMVSIRDDKSQKHKSPILSYAIASILNKVLDPATSKFRTTYSILLDLAVFESNTPLSWCEYEELKDAQNRQALFSKLEGLLQDIIVILVKPSRVSKDVKDQDTIYYKYEFRFEGFTGGTYYSGKGMPKMTGTYIEFNISCLMEENEICCVDDGSKEIAEKMQGLVKEGSNSYRFLQKRIDA